jgi:hypothetical protein
MGGVERKCYVAKWRGKPHGCWVHLVLLRCNAVFGENTEKGPQCSSSNGITTPTTTSYHYYYYTYGKFAGRSLKQRYSVTRSYIYIYIYLFIIIIKGVSSNIRCYS